MDPEVRIHPREQWRAAAPKIVERLKGPAQRVVIHHTALPSCANLNQCSEQVLSIQRAHMAERGFSDIGYNFIVGKGGIIMEGRGWGVVGAHSKGNNHDSVGIAFMGNFNGESPSAASMRSVKQLLQLGLSRGFLSKGFAVFGHRDLSPTECPGDNLYAALPQLQHGNCRLLTL